MSKLQNPLPHIREQLKHKTVNIPVTCPLCGREAKAIYVPKAIPFITIECPNCVKYSAQEDFFEDFDDVEHSYLLSGDIRHTQENMDGHFISVDIANDVIRKQKELESENRSMAYLVWQYDQIDGSWDGWKEYIDLPAVAYCKDSDELKKLTEKAVELGYMEEKDDRYKATVAGVNFFNQEYEREARKIALCGSKEAKPMSKMKDEAQKLVDTCQDILRTEIKHPERGLAIPDYISGPKYDKWTTDLQVFADTYIRFHPCYEQLKKMASGHDEMPGTCSKINGILKSIVEGERDDWSEPIQMLQAEKIPNRKQYDVFISHANKDKLDYVDLLNASVKRLGINVFYDSDVLSWGDKWKQVILDGTASSEFAIIVISQNFFDREWTERELHEFLTRQNESGQKIVLPLLYGITIDQLCEKYPELGDIQCIKAENFTKEEIVILLAKELIKRYR